MTKLKLLGAAAIVSAMIVTPVIAQQALPEPGEDAQSRTLGAAGAVGGATGIGGVRGSNSYAYYGGRSYENSDIYYGDRPVTRRTTCGLQPDATYLGPDGRWYAC